MKNRLFRWAVCLLIAACILPLCLSVGAVQRGDAQYTNPRTGYQALILDDSTIDGSEEGLMYDNDCGYFGALSYLKAVYYDEYQAKLAEEKELYGTHDEADAEPEPTIVTVHVSKEKLSDEMKAKLTAALFEEEEVDG